MGIILQLRNASGSTTWSADTVLLRFTESRLNDVDLTKNGASVYHPDPIPADKLDSLEASDGDKFEVLLEDAHGNKHEPYSASWVKTAYPPGFEVAFGPALRETGAGLIGEMWAVAVLEHGQLDVKKLDMQDH